MRADELAKSLGRGIGEDYEVSILPDHPYLHMGPEILVAAPGNLIAGFVLKREEQRANEILLARLIAARLALPDHTRCVLLCPEGRQPPNGAELDFNEVITEGYQKNFNLLLKDRNSGRDIDRVPEETRTRAILRYELLYAESVKRMQTASRRPQARIGVEDLRGRAEIYSDKFPRLFRYQRSRNLPELEYNGGLIAEVRGDKPSMQMLKALCVESLGRAYVLDNGVPYERSNAPNLLLTSFVPLGRLDPLKPVRAAAFAGWAFTRSDSAERFFDYADYLQEQFAELQA